MLPRLTTTATITTRARRRICPCIQNLRTTSDTRIRTYTRIGTTRDEILVVAMVVVVVVVVVLVWTAGEEEKKDRGVRGRLFLFLLVMVVAASLSLLCFFSLFFRLCLCEKRLDRQPHKKIKKTTKREIKGMNEECWMFYMVDSYVLNACSVRGICELLSTCMHKGFILVVSSLAR